MYFNISFLETVSFFYSYKSTKIFPRAIALRSVFEEVPIVEYKQTESPDLHISFYYRWL